MKSESRTTARESVWFQNSYQKNKNLQVSNTAQPNCKQKEFETTDDPGGSGNTDEHRFFIINASIVKVLDI